VLVPNHGKVFHSLMVSHMPDWEERQEALDEIDQLL
jgi:hypothetical protein